MIPLLSDLTVFPNMERSVTSRPVVICPEESRGAKGSTGLLQRRSLLPRALRVCVCGIVFMKLVLKFFLAPPLHLPLYSSDSASLPGDTGQRLQTLLLGERDVLKSGGGQGAAKPPAVRGSLWRVVILLQGFGL